MNQNRQSFQGKVVNGIISWQDKNSKDIFLGSLEGKEVLVTIEVSKDRRTSAQNRSLHLYFQKLADALNDSGQEVKEFLQVDVPWTPILVKEIIWRRVMEMYLKKHSTTDMDKISDITAVYEIVNRAVGERAGVHVPFPSIESQAEELTK